MSLFDSRIYNSAWCHMAERAKTNHNLDLHQGQGA
jgi:hypothetical protein